MVELFNQEDDFFHITCHVDATLKSKIEKGEFVELDKLIPKDPTKHMYDYGKMEFMSHDGATFFIPSTDKDNKINGIRRWEQAFRVYAAIYSRANPSKAAEIWQYVHTINLATSSFVWDNVAAYDSTFRQLMSKYPNRSWAIIYQQMWSLSMREPLHRSSGASVTGSNSQRSSNYGGKKERDCCGA